VLSEPTQKLSQRIREQADHMKEVELEEAPWFFEFADETESLENQILQKDEDGKRLFDEKKALEAECDTLNKKNSFLLGVHAAQVDIIREQESRLGEAQKLIKEWRSKKYRGLVSGLRGVCADELESVLIGRD
jgi:hypothetical protein